MNVDVLKETVQTLLADGKGILAADETPANIGRKFACLHLDNTPENRSRYREMLFTSEGIEKYISGVILQDETIRQSGKDQQTYSKYLLDKGILSGIKVDMGLVPFAEGSLETITQGLDGLVERLKEYKESFAKFAKWRAVIHISNNELPTDAAIQANVEALAEYAYICQSVDIVPIVEPEVLMDGNHTIETCYDVTKRVLTALFKALEQRGVLLEGILLKPNMVVAGLMCDVQASAEDVANKTLACFKETLPSALPGIVFLSGGQSDELAIEHLALMNKQKPLPWVLSFSYGRALQRKALTVWKGDDSNVLSAQDAFLSQAKLNSLAALGEFA